MASGDGEELTVMFKGFCKRITCFGRRNARMEESERVHVWGDLPSVLWDINLLRYGFFFFVFFLEFTLSQHSCQREKSEKQSEC